MKTKVTTLLLVVFSFINQSGYAEGPSVSGGSDSASTTGDVLTFFLDSTRSVLPIQVSGVIDKNINNTSTVFFDSIKSFTANSYVFSVSVSGLEANTNYLMRLTLTNADGSETSMFPFATLLGTSVGVISTSSGSLSVLGLDNFVGNNEQLTLYSILGQAQFTKIITQGTETFNVSNLPKGLYIVSLSGSERITKTVVIQ